MIFMYKCFYLWWLKFTEIPIFNFSAFFQGGHIENGYVYNIACDLNLATCSIRKSIKIYRKKLIWESPEGGVHRELLHPRLTCIFCDPFDLSDPKIDPFCNFDYFVRQLWFVNSFRWFRKFTGSICIQAIHLPTNFFLPHWPRPMTLTPFLRYFWSYFSLAQGSIQSGLKKWF